MDDDYHANETGFTSSLPGDSGSPYWMKVQGAIGYVTTVAVNAVIAVHTTHIPTGNVAAFYMQNETFQCRLLATKITSKISRWIMAWHNRVA